MKVPRLKNIATYKYLFKRDTILATLFVFLIMGLFEKIEKTLGILDPKEITSKGFDYNDLAFNLLSKHADFPVDTGIYIVKIGNADRNGIASIINNINLAHPAVIGADILFKGASKPEQDTLLRNVFAKSNLLVSAYSFSEEQQRMGNYFTNIKSKSGYVNFTAEPQNVIREFTPYIIHGDTSLSFAAAVVKVANKAAYQQLTDRENETEVINYTRNDTRFIVIDGNSKQADFDILKGKIVLVGAVDSGYYYEDKHFTPLNPKFVGKSMPDLSGILIHANIIRMILDHNYVSRTPEWLNWLIAMLICWLHMAFFIRYFIETHVWFHLAAKVAQLISAVFFIFLSLFCFYELNLQLDMTLVIVAIVLAVDVLYFYEAIVLWLHQKIGFKTLFHHEHAK